MKKKIRRGPNAARLLDDALMITVPNADGNSAVLARLFGGSHADPVHTELKMAKCEGRALRCKYGQT